MEYDYSRLRGKIVEKYNTMLEFSKVIDISYEALSKKLNNKIAISQNEISRWCELLDIDVANIGAYFFTLKVQII